MNIETLAQSAPASSRLQASPTPSTLVAHSKTAAPLIDTNVLAGTNVKIAPLYVKSGKEVTFSATVTTTSSEKPAGTTMLSAGSKILCEARVTRARTSMEVNTTVVKDPVAATYSGDQRHASATDVLVKASGTGVIKVETLEGDHGLTAPVLAGVTTEESPIPDYHFGGALIRQERLGKQIANSWSAHEQNKSALKIARRSSLSIRKDLGEDLAAYKLILAKTGRDGKWTGFLETIGIPRTTADRLIANWLRETSPKPAIRTTGAIDGPTNEDISGLVKTLTSRAKRVLTTDASVAQFLFEISEALRVPASSQ